MIRTLKPNLLDLLPVQRLWLGLQKVRGQQRSPAVQTMLPPTDVPALLRGRKEIPPAPFGQLIALAEKKKKAELA